MRYTQAIKSVIDQNPNYGTRLQQAERIATKWQKLGLMQGLDHPKDTLLRTNVAIMLQNEAKQIIKEANYTSTTQYHEQWVGIAMPLIRRFMFKLASKDFVTIQAMSQPAGLVFFLDHQFGSDKELGRFTAGSSINGTTFSGTTGNFDYVMDTDITAGFYNAGRWGYSLNDQFAYPTPTPTSGSQIRLADVFNDTQMWSSSTYATSMTDGKIKKLSIALSALTNPDLNGYSAWNIKSLASVTDTTSATYISKVFPQYTKLNGTSVEFIVLTGGTGSFSGAVTCSYHKQPQTYDRGDFQYQGTNLEIPEVQFKLTQKPIVPETRKMKATWTQQLVDDLNAFLAIDGQQEISNQLTDQITLQTDLELVSLIGKGGIESGNLGYFSVRPGYELSNVDAYGSATFTANTNYAIQDKPSWFRNIGIPMQKISNMIHQKTGKGGANFAIVSPTLATVLETIEGFVATGATMDGSTDWMEAGFTQVGTFRNRYRIYKNPYSVADNAMIMGYRGTGFLDFGAAYCPYIPLIMLPNIMQPTNLTPTKGVYTRYAKTMLRKDYYGALFVQGLQTV